MLTKQSYKKFWKLLNKHDNYLVTSHINPDGDGICSTIILSIILKSLKKKYYLLMEDVFPEKFKFLIKDYTNFIIPELINIPKNEDLRNMLPESFIPESAIILDTRGNDRLGNFSKCFSDLKTVLNIDHHIGKRQFAGTIDLVDQNASATGEIIFNLLKAGNFKIRPDVAKLIYISIVTDTRNFTQANTTSETHLIISELLRTNIKPEEILFYLEEIPAKALRIYGRVIARSRLEFNNKLIWSYITQKELNECVNSDIDGLIEILRNAKNTCSAILFKELNKNKVKASLRGKKGFNVYKIAKKFNGGGHKQAAGFSYSANLKTAIKILLRQLQKYF